MRRDQVLSQLSRQLPGLRDRFDVERLRLFGSVAWDDARPDSGVDLQVEFRRPVGFFCLIEVQALLEKSLGCKVDLGTARSLKPRLRAGPLAEARRSGMLL